MSEDSERQPLVKESPDTRPWGRILLGLAAALAVSVVAVQGLGPVKTAPSVLLAASDSGDEFGCGCTIQWCCDNKDLFNDDFTSKGETAEDTPCAMLAEPITKSQDAYFDGSPDPKFDAKTICAEVDSGKRDGSSSVCDQPEMFKVAATYTQEPQHMIMVEFGKSCGDGPSCELPGRDLETVGDNADSNVVGTWLRLTDLNWEYNNYEIKGYDNTTNKHGYIQISTCFLDFCDAGKGLPFYVVPGDDYRTEDLCDQEYVEPAGHVGPYGDGKHAYGTCVDFVTLSGATGRAVFTDLSGSEDTGLNSASFAEANPRCVQGSPDTPTPAPVQSPTAHHKKSDGAASTTACVALVVALLAALLAY